MNPKVIPSIINPFLKTFHCLYHGLFVCKAVVRTSNCSWCQSQFEASWLAEQMCVCDLTGWGSVSMEYSNYQYNTAFWPTEICRNTLCWALDGKHARTHACAHTHKHIHTHIHLYHTHTGGLCVVSWLKLGNLVLSQENTYRPTLPLSLSLSVSLSLCLSLSLSLSVSVFLFYNHTQTQTHTHTPYTHTSTDTLKGV